jgi:outer membrane protein OmpA-like peptidoglycan-associated protein
VNILARFLQFLRETKSERKLVLAGFSDSAGAVDKNVALSLERANAVRQALLHKDPQYVKLIDTRGMARLFRLPATRTRGAATRTAASRCG